MKSPGGHLMDAAKMAALFYGIKKGSGALSDVGEGLKAKNDPQSAMLRMGTAMQGIGNGLQGQSSAGLMDDMNTQMQAIEDKRTDEEADKKRKKKKKYGPLEDGMMIGAPIFADPMRDMSQPMLAPPSQPMLAPPSQPGPMLTPPQGMVQPQRSMLPPYLSPSMFKIGV